jgi:hypothetical protein
VRERSTLRTDHEVILIWETTFQREKEHFKDKPPKKRFTKEETTTVHEIHVKDSYSIYFVLTTTFKTAEYTGNPRIIGTGPEIAI